MNPHPKNWSWIIPVDKAGKSIDPETTTELLRGFCAQFSLRVLHDGQGNPTNVKVVEPELGGKLQILGGCKLLVMDNKLETPPEIITQMGAFLTGFFTHRTYAA